MSTTALLPEPPTPLVGREQELEAGRTMLTTPGLRLVTLTGPGGSGKTRLAIELARDCLASFEHGAVFTDLAPLRDPDLVLTAVGRTLGLQEAGPRGMVEGLREYLQHRQLLLVLDNFEHVVPAATALADLLSACPRVKVLATSREPLRLRAENLLPIPPLPLPDRGEKDPTAIAQAAAVVLFTQRARAVQPTFCPDALNSRVVAQICAQLDGLPLAIELAAARVRLLPLDELLDRLSRRLDVLRGGAADAPARHQTLRAAIDWSYRLLSQNAQVLFRRMSVFSGGATLSALEAVCSGGGLDPESVFDLLGELVDRSLVSTSAKVGGAAKECARGS